ncbi:hypothetical protein ACQ4PT_024903 [Festuca glaucescens]
MEACFPCLGARKRPPPVEATPGDPQHRNVAARTFSFEELAAATRHFRDGCLVADHSPDKARLDWSTRMNIAAGVARGLEYLHDRGMVYRCMRSSDILLGDGDGYYPKLSQYGLAELGQHLGETDEAFTTTYLGTLSPETAMIGKLSPASDVYSFGVLLLEMITGRRPSFPGPP